MLSLTTRVPPRPFLKWAGGKGQLLAQYEPFFPGSFSTYYEPFQAAARSFFASCRTTLC